MKSAITSIMTALMLLAAATPAAAADLNVNITGVRNANGTIIVCLWTSGWGFPDCESSRDNVVIQRQPAQPGTMTFVFPGIAAGRYAVSVAHDQNNDGKLERHKFLKYPLEGAGVSNYLTPPRFAPFHHEALFDVNEPGVSIAVPMLYPPQ
jgi:uncharacterized protein (DUF2141 family)